MTSMTLWFFLNLSLVELWPFLKLAKELDGDKVESWAKGLSDRWINNDDLARQDIQKIRFTFQTDQIYKNWSVNPL